MKVVFALDSNCIVAAISTWHDRHGAAKAEIERRLKRGERLVVAAHALAEAYAVLTRLPSPYRLDPGDAWAVLAANFAGAGAIEALDAQDYLSVLERLALSGVGGGRTYDALIGECAVRAQASVLLTLNPRHFDPPPPGVVVVEPETRARTR